jgi:hypothetical protein
VPVVATPATPIVVTVDQVRRFMQDYPSKNILLDDVEFTQEDINQGVEIITSLWNSTTPISQILPQSWPRPFFGILLFGVAWYLLRSAAILQLRNQATYQDGDISPIGAYDKEPQYLALSQTMKAEWDQMVKDVKVQLNMESAYGSLSSGYRNTSRYHYS